MASTRKRMIVAVLACCLLAAMELVRLINSMTPQPQSFLSNKFSARLERLTLLDFMDGFPWQNLENHWDDLFYRMTKANMVEPHTPIDETCTTPDLSTLQCTSGAVFSGETQRKKIGHAIILGFDVDTLEIHLNEVYDVVDKFFIVEWTLIHNGNFGGVKPLTWDGIKHQSRFRKFQDKVVHLILDDVDTLEVVDAQELFERENYQEMQRWENIKRWNDKTHFFKPDDLIGFGDADEVPSRENLYLLKHCALKPGIQTVDIGIWFPKGRFNQAFRTDFPVSLEHPYTLGDPTFWTFQAAMDSKDVPSRRRGTSDAFLLGGVHLSDYKYLPFILLKQMSCTECSLKLLSQLGHQIQETFQRGSWRELESKLAETPQRSVSRIVPVETVSGLEYRPWFYTCNPRRYPAWEGNPDSRIEA